MTIKFKPTIPLEPASMDQVQGNLEHGFVTIDSDVGDIVKQIKAIDPRFSVEYNKRGEFFALFTTEPAPGGGETQHLVNTFKELDQRVVNRLMEILHPDYNFGQEIQELEDKHKADFEADWHDRVMEKSEHLAFVIRKELGIDKDHAFISDGKIS